MVLTCKPNPALAAALASLAATSRGELRGTAEEIFSRLRPSMTTAQAGDPAMPMNAAHLDHLMGELASLGSVRSYAEAGIEVSRPDRNTWLVRRVGSQPPAPAVHARHQPAITALSLLRGQPWAIVPEYLRAVEDILSRVPESEVLTALANDGHAQRHQATLGLMSHLGSRLEGSPSALVRDGVAIVPVLGVIAPRVSQLNVSTPGTSMETLARDIKVAEAAANVRQILLLTDSPGGMVPGVNETGMQIAASRKPITAFVQGEAASAAYWLISQAREIVVESTALVGSIGVVVSIPKRVAPTRDGMTSHEIVSTGAPQKRPDPTTDEGRANVQTLVDSLEAEFVAAVARGRRVTTEKVRSDFGRGGLIVGRHAVAAGMADRVDTLEATIARLGRGAQKTAA